MRSSPVAQLSNTFVVLSRHLQLRTPLGTSNLFFVVYCRQIHGRRYKARSRPLVCAQIATTICLPKILHSSSSHYFPSTMTLPLTLMWRIRPKLPALYHSMRALPEELLLWNVLSLRLVRAASLSHGGSICQLEECFQCKYRIDAVND